MALSKKFMYDYEDYEEGGKDAGTLGDSIVADPQLTELTELIVGCWGEAYENPVQVLLDKLVAAKARLQKLEHLFIGDMNYEECEVSWIQQGNYQGILEALPCLKRLTIKGSEGLDLGKVDHASLEELEIICGGLPQRVLNQLAEAKLPKLHKLNLYLGVDEYGFDGTVADIKAVLDNPSFAQLRYLGLGDSEEQDAVVKLVVTHPIVTQLKELSFANGTLSDAGGQILLEHQNQLRNLRKLDLTYHFLSDDMMTKLAKLPCEVCLDDQQEDDKEYGNYPMLTE